MRLCPSKGSRVLLGVFRTGIMSAYEDHRLSGIGSSPVVATGRAPSWAGSFSPAHGLDLRPSSVSSLRQDPTALHGAGVGTQQDDACHPAGGNQVLQAPAVVSIETLEGDSGGLWHPEVTSLRRVPSSGDHPPSPGCAAPPSVTVRGQRSVRSAAKVKVSSARPKCLPQSRLGTRAG